MLPPRHSEGSAELELEHACVAKASSGFRGNFKARLYATINLVGILLQTPEKSSQRFDMRCFGCCFQWLSLPVLQLFDQARFRDGRNIIIDRGLIAHIRNISESEFSCPLAWLSDVRVALCDPAESN